MKILICYGTRPELIKINPLINEFKKRNINFSTLNVRQHTTLINENADFVLEIKDAKNLNRLDSIISSISEFDQKFFENITHVLIQGDTATALMCAIAAFNRQIPVIHLEAGLRTYDNKNPYPEEVYRQMISRIASIHFCPTEQNAFNLKKEQITDSVYVVGNTVLDNLVHLRNCVSYDNEVLITLHRRENHDKIEEWFKIISEIATANSNLLYTLPIHPNPNVMKYKDILKNVNVISPLPYEQFIKKLVTCRYILSDSGGIQEEASFLGKKVIVCRKVTERPESVGINSILCFHPNKLIDIEKQIINNYKIEPNNIFGNGNSSELISSILEKLRNENI